MQVKDDYNMDRALVVELTELRDSGDMYDVQWTGLSMARCWA